MRRKTRPGRGWWGLAGPGWQGNPPFISYANTCCSSHTPYPGRIRHLFFKTKGKGSGFVEPVKRRGGSDMHGQFTVAIVGRPNVGKSRLFNRLLGERVSIVHDMPGVTRDTITREVERDGYTIVDTGGMGLVAEMSDTPEAIVSAVEEQIAFSISAADLILMVVDGREGLVPLDIEMSDTIRKSSKPVMLVVNKVDKADSPIEPAIGPWNAISPSRSNDTRREPSVADPFRTPIIMPVLGSRAVALSARLPRPNWAKSRTVPVSFQSPVSMSSCRITAVPSPLFTVCKKPVGLAAQL